MNRIFSIDTFSTIPKKSLLALQQSCMVLDYPKGNFLYSIGDSVNGVFVVLTGQFISYRLTQAGKQCTVRTLAIGQFIGEEDIFTTLHRDTYVESTQDSQCLYIPKKDYEMLLLSFPKFSLKRFESICQHLKETELTMQVIAYNTIKQRLLLILKKLGTNTGSRAANEIHLTLNWSHEDLASMIGSTRESITHAFTLLQNEGVLKIKNKTVSINIDKLNNYL